MSPPRFDSPGPWFGISIILVLMSLFSGPLGIESPPGMLSVCTFVCLGVANILRKLESMDVH